MPYGNLREFITRLEKDERLVRVTEAVSPHLEVTEIQTRLLAEGGPAVLFENPIRPDGTPYGMPILVNLFGTVERVAWAMDKEPGELRAMGEMLALMRQPEPPGGLRDAIDMLPMVKSALAMKPKTRRSAPCHDVVIEGEDIDLGQLPIQTCWPGEPAPLISWPLIVTRKPGGSDADYNLGVYRLQVIGPKQTLVRWLRHRGGAQHFQEQVRESAEPLPMAVVIGGDPGTILAAVAPVPDNLSEYQFAGLLRGAKVELAACKTIPLKVPAEAEMVIEGHVALDDFRDEGPFNDHTGYYNAIEPFPVFTISAITMRRDPIYLSTFTGRPPDEPSVIGEALNELFIPLIQQQFPEIVDFWLPPEACSYRVAVVSIRKTYPGQARRVMMSVWSYLRQFLYTKMVIVVDDDIDARDWKDVMWAIATRMDPVRDTMLVENTPIDYLDFASPEPSLGGKMGLDATNKIPPETHRAWGRPARMNDETIDKVSREWQRYGLPGSGKPIWK